MARMNRGRSEGPQRGQNGRTGAGGRAGGGRIAAAGEGAGGRAGGRAAGAGARGRAGGGRHFGAADAGTTRRTSGRGARSDGNPSRYEDGERRVSTAGRSRGARAEQDNPGTQRGRFGKAVAASGGRSRGRKVTVASNRGHRMDDATFADGGERDNLSPEIITGRHPIIEALKSGRPINKIVVAENTEGGSLTELLGKAKAAGIVIQTAPRTHLTSVADGESHQGVIAYVAPQSYAEVDDILARDTGVAPLVVLLDEVSDPHNFGAILRSAEATGVQGVIIPKRRAVPLTNVVAKAAAGALEYVPVARVSNLVQAMERLKAEGYWIVGTDLEAEQSYGEVDYRGKIAIVIGAEGKGLGRLVKEHCDFLVKLPMLGKLQSLNASVAAGVLLYEIVRQRA